MENNWKEKVKEIYNKNVKSILDDEGRMEAFLEFGNLVFEATKKECADKAEVRKYYENHEDFKNKKLTDDTVVNKDSILNIEKPNL
jgi:uncharacterized protein (DUF1697 family)